MPLAKFIDENVESIAREWEIFAQSIVSFASDMTPLALRDHIEEILEFVTTDMRSPQTHSEQILKSHGKGAPQEGEDPSTAETHATLRLEDGFNLDQMVSEYRALRASVIKLWSKDKKETSMQDLRDLTRFNEAIDQIMTESISHYVQKLDESKNLFLGLLTHDLRNPLGAAMMSAQLVPKIGPLNERQSVLIAQITESTARIDEIVSHLLDITRARFGAGLPVVRKAGDIGYIGRQIVDEMSALHPTRHFALDISGNMQGEWDKARISQVFSNLIGNAVQYSFKETPITLTISGDTDNVTLTVHNEGRPIPPGKTENIFESLIRVTQDNHGHMTGKTTNLGLGLYITKEIVTAHGGTIKVTSSEKDGTTFTITLPRFPHHHDHLPKHAA